MCTLIYMDSRTSVGIVWYCHIQSAMFKMKVRIKCKWKSMHSKNIGCHMFEFQIEFELFKCNICSFIDSYANTGAWLRSCFTCTFTVASIYYNNWVSVLHEVIKAWTLWFEKTMLVQVARQYAYSFPHMIYITAVLLYPCAAKWLR